MKRWSEFRAESANAIKNILQMAVGSFSWLPYCQCCCGIERFSDQIVVVLVIVLRRLLLLSLLTYLWISLVAWVGSPFYRCITPSRPPENQ